MAEPSNNYGRRGVYTKKFNTEGGMNREEKAAVLAWEAKKRNLKTERMAVFDSHGRVIGESKSGSANRTKLRTTASLKDAIITHNHPISQNLGGGLASRIGQSFSGTDLATTIRNDAKEIRVVTGGYTFSMRRPKNGWGVSPSRVKADADMMLAASELFERQNYVGKAGLTYEERVNRNGRFYVATINRTWRELAKKYGWTYTRRKNG